jgi:hypothetical protein
LESNVVEYGNGDRSPHDGVQLEGRRGNSRITVELLSDRYSPGIPAVDPLLKIGGPVRTSVEVQNSPVTGNPCTGVVEINCENL